VLRVRRGALALGLGPDSWLALDLVRLNPKGALLARL